MSDWGEEDAGRGFGNGSTQYKDSEDNVDDGGNDYNDNDAGEENRGFSRRGRGGGRGRGARSERQSDYGYGRRNYEDNEDNEQSNEYQSETTNSFVPDNFERATVENFLAGAPDRVRRSKNLLELYCLARYTLKAFKIYISTEMSKHAGAASTDNIIRDVGDYHELVQERNDIDEEYFGLVGAGKSITNGNIEMSDLIIGKNKADSEIQFQEDIVFAAIHQSQLPDLSEILKGPSDSIQAKNSVTSFQCRTNRKGKNNVVSVGYQHAPAQAVRLAVTPNITTRITEKECALRKRIPARTFLEIVANEDPMIENARIMAFNFFPLRKTWANDSMTSVRHVRQLVPLSTEKQSQLVEISDGASGSINVARQHVSPIPAGGLPSIQLGQSQLEGPSTDNFDDNIDTIQMTRDVWPPHSETDGQQERSDIVPELSADGTFFTPDPIPFPTGISSRSDESEEKRSQLVQSVSGPSSAHRADILTSKTATLPSIREEEFRHTLLRRTFRDTDLSSTPLRPLMSIVSNNRIVKNVQIFPTEDSTKLTNNDLKPGMGDTNLDIKSGATSTSADIINVAFDAQTISNRQDLESYHTEITSEAIHATESPKEPPLACEKKNWFEVLRERQVDVSYVKEVEKVARRRKRRRLRPHLLPIGDKTAVQLSYQMNNTDKMLLIPQLAADDFPILLEPVLVQSENIYESASREEVPMTILQKKIYDNFVFEHIESISTIMDNLVEWQRVLKACHRNIGSTTYSTGLLSASYAYDTDTLIYAKSECLQLKLNLLQEIIRNASFDLLKSPLLKNRHLAAVAFHFLLELKTADIIRIMNGYVVELI
ncbi:uncharacterized protein LOC101456741 isoform X2 [Ceratitis capitata]|nr:uncharacterized protein LOC101456741 isoform X2 [Ceratitis capitata]XP_012154952.1 uncharacterized protein LOC101456741 isoform X2 [Ceratitis capitata]XP_012154953.1 uncharacterized protein LOC101456741 isoform X2 [Ceratitis capitata]